MSSAGGTSGVLWASRSWGSLAYRACLACLASLHGSAKVLPQLRQLCNFLQSQLRNFSPSCSRLCLSRLVPGQNALVLQAAHFADSLQVFMGNSRKPEGNCMSRVEHLLGGSSSFYPPVDSEGHDLASLPNEAFFLGRLLGF